MARIEHSQLCEKPTPSAHWYGRGGQVANPTKFPPSQQTDEGAVDFSPTDVGRCQKERGIADRLLSDAAELEQDKRPARVNCVEGIVTPTVEVQRVSNTSASSRLLTI